MKVGIHISSLDNTDRLIIALYIKGIGIKYCTIRKSFLNEFFIRSIYNNLLNSYRIRFSVSAFFRRFPHLSKADFTEHSSIDDQIETLKILGVIS